MDFNTFQRLFGALAFVCGLLAQPFCGFEVVKKQARIVQELYQLKNGESYEVK
jgi:hypothetical protein